MQDDSDDPTPTVVRQFAEIVEALDEITTGVAVLLTSRTRREEPSRELQQIMTGVDAITASVRAALAAIAPEVFETAPDVIPVEWLE